MRPFLEFEPAGAFTPDAVVTASVESDARAVLLDRAALPPAFFDLRTGVAGDLTQRLGMFGIRLACVVPDLGAQPERFREFAREANRGGRVRFFESRASAVAWLASEA